MSSDCQFSSGKFCALPPIGQQHSRVRSLSFRGKHMQRSQYVCLWVDGRLVGFLLVVHCVTLLLLLDVCVVYKDGNGLQNMQMKIHWTECTNLLSVNWSRIWSKTTASMLSTLNCCWWWMHPFDGAPVHVCGFATLLPLPSLGIPPHLLKCACESLWCKTIYLIVESTTNKPFSLTYSTSSTSPAVYHKLKPPLLALFTELQT